MHTKRLARAIALVWLVCEGAGQALAKPAEVVRAALPGGTRVLAVRDRLAPRIWASAVWSAGARIDPADGLSAILAESFTAGCGGRRAGSLSRALVLADTALTARADRDTFELAAELPRRGWQRGFDLFADCIERPQLAAAAVDASRRRLLAARGERARTPAALAEHILYAARFSQDLLGTEQSLDDLDRDQLLAHHQRHMPLASMVLVVVGDLAPRDLIAHVTRRFARSALGSASVAGSVSGSASVAGSASGSASVAGSASGSGVELFAYVDGDIAEVAVSLPGARLADPDRAAFEVLAAVLARRLAAKLRGAALAHRMSARSVSHLDTGSLEIRLSCRPDRLSRAIAALHGEIERLHSAGARAGELAPAVRRARAVHDAAGARPGDLARALATVEALGPGHPSRAGHRRALAAVRAADLARVAARALAPDAAITATVMPALASREAARRARGAVKRAPRAGARRKGRR
jgi:predicted Zn-dependent peptidase